MKVEPFEDDEDLLSAIAAVRGTGPLSSVSLHELRKLFKQMNPTMLAKYGRVMTGLEFKDLIYNVVGLHV